MIWINTMDKQWLDRGPCPNCGSSDGNVQHKEGYSHCFVCGTHRPPVRLVATARIRQKEFPIVNGDSDIRL